MNSISMNFLCVQFIFMENKNSKCFIKFKISFFIFYMWIPLKFDGFIVYQFTVLALYHKL